MFAALLKRIKLRIAIKALLICVKVQSTCILDCTILQLGLHILLYGLQKIGRTAWLEYVLVPLSDIRSSVSESVSPSPRGGGRSRLDPL